MIGGSILYLVRRGPRHGDRGRAAAERHDGKPAAARHPAVHPRRRIHEHRQHHGQAAALLQRDRRALPGRSRAGQRRAEHHLRQHVGIRARRRRGLGQADAVADDARRQVHAGVRRRADHRVVGHRAHHAAVDPAGALRADIGHVGRLPLPRRRDTRPAARRRPERPDQRSRPSGATSRSRSASRCATCRASPGMRSRRC